MTNNINGNKVLYNMYDEQFNNTSVGIINCEKNGIVKYINERAFAILALEQSFKSPADLPGNNILEVITEYKKIFEKVLNKNSLNEFELYFSTPDDTIRWVLNDVFFVEFREQKTINILLKDITKYKNLEFEFEKSQKILQSLLGSVPDIVYSLDSEGMITYISETIQKYGYKPDDLIGTCFFELIHPEDRADARFRVGERRTGKRKTRSYEIRLLTKNHDIIQFDLDSKNQHPYQFFLINSEGIYLNKNSNEELFLGSHGIARDVHDIKTITNVLQENEESWKAIIDTLDDCYCEIDPEGVIKIVNSSFCKLVGYSSDELIGQPVDTVMDSDDDKSSFDYINKCLTGDHKPKLFYWRFERKDLKKRYTESTITLIKDLKGNTVGYRCIIRDMTNTQKVKEELIRARKMEAIGILSGGLAHDYNNALTAILGNISLAKMYISPENKELFEVIDDAEQASLKVMDLTKRLSTFARGGKPVKKKVSLPLIIDEVIDKVLNDFTGTVKLEVQEDLDNIELDEVQFRHALENIVHNAMEISPPDGTITISVKKVTTEKEATLHELSLQPGDFLIISVEDQGSGIPESDIRNIFDPYFTTKDYSEGMGLAISYAVVKRHKGYIDVISELNKGTRFDIYLPVE